VKTPDERLNLIYSKYYGIPLNEVPFDYLFWVFPKLKRDKRDIELFHRILEYYLTFNVSVEDNSKENLGYCFYFDEFKLFYPGTEKEVPFITSNWRGKDSSGEYVYEISQGETNFYIHQGPKKWVINYNIVYLNYIYGGQSMVYEKHPGYYFYNNFNTIINGAYLMRKPWMPEDAPGEFSENIKI
jgi:hypothetical protein